MAHKSPIYAVTSGGFLPSISVQEQALVICDHFKGGYSMMRMEKIVIFVTVVTLISATMVGALPAQAALVLLEVYYFIVSRCFCASRYTV